MLRAGLTFMAVAALGFAAGSASSGLSSPPAGATAICRDGTYSFSQHHSGTCSYHGGVAQWLAGTASPSGGGAAAASSRVDVGRTVLLASRTATSGCKLGARPDRACSPGGFYSKLTTGVICSGSFHTSTIRSVPQSEKYAVEREYGLAPSHYGSTLEIDHIVSLELGGSNDIANLFPEKAGVNAGYRVKDRLENKLHALVCSGSMTLRAAQEGIAADWEALYAKAFGALPGS